MNAYEKVEALRLRYPDMKLRDLARKAGVHLSSYYGQKKRAAKPKTRRTKSAYERIETEAPRATGKIPVIFCSPEQIRELFQ